MGKPHGVPLVFLALATFAAGCGDAAGPGDGGRPIPPPGPHYSVLPIPLEKLARVTPLGFNNKPMPTGHTYWDTCDRAWYFASPRPCVLEQLPIRAPADGIVYGVGHGEDGWVSIEGPPGLIATFGHVAPAAALRRGQAVRAGDVLATMTYTHGFDFGVMNLGIERHRFVNMARIHEGYAYAQSPIAQYPEPLRSELIARVYTRSNPLGRLSYDMAGTAAGAWFLQGTPVSESLNVVYSRNQLFLGLLQERDDIRIMTVGERWPGLQNMLVVIDPGAPSWSAITAASGPVALKGWALDRDGSPQYGFPQGTLLVEVLTGERLRIEWFDTHAPVSAFTAAARTYER